MRRIAFSLLALATTALAQDLALNTLLIDGEGWQPVAQDLGFADGPCTDAAGNFYYSDMKVPSVVKVALDGTKTLLIDELASGLKFGPDGRLYACRARRSGSSPSSSPRRRSRKSRPMCSPTTSR